MDVTVAICTWNRATLLSRVLTSLTELNRPIDTNWELLVVNNNCTDDTDSVVQSFADRLPIRVLHERAPGLSNARNKAISEASGRYILWTDDDVRVSQNWLEAYLAAFRRWPDHGIFGGPIRPEFEGDPPGWLTSVWNKVETAYAMRDFGMDELELSARTHRLPFGANFAIRSDLQRSHPYDPKLGRSPQNLFLGGEEVAVMARILDAGTPGRWVPHAGVLHWVPRGRQTVAYLRGYYKGQGVHQAMTMAPDRTARLLLGRPRWLIRRYLQQEIRYRVARLTASPTEWIDALVVASESAGMLVALSSNGAAEPRGV
ncbi:MAG: glycosyltransferase family 2 protein [Burkholderiales bacterium]|nr:glycosyltransferase family 2 protein [Burkholderiales bacterium]